MSKTKPERIANIDERIAQLKNQQKLLRQQYNAQERKARNHRICRRGGYLESRLPETITLTDEQYNAFLEKTLFSEYSRKILSGLTKQNTETVSSISTKAVSQPNSTTVTEPHQIEVEYDEGAEEYEDEE